MREPKDIKIGNYTLKEILERHQHWLNKDCEKWEYMRADLHGTSLYGANLYGANLCSADLRGANLYYANLRDANLYYANLRDADLSGADLYDANLRGAELSGADLHFAYLRGAGLRGAYLHGAYLHGAYLHGANLSGANLHGTDLSCADLNGADLSGADLHFANLSGANLYNVNLSFNDRLRKGIKLSEPIIGWKKCQNNVLVKLEIPRGAIVFSINNSKCRTDKAKVLEIIGADRAYSRYDKTFSYYVGDVIEIFDFNCEYNVECARGIHFFKTIEEAENY